MALKILIFIFLMFLTLVVGYVLENTNTLSWRLKQSKNLLRENVLKTKLEKIVDNRVKLTRRAKLETLCLQAGFQISYFEFMTISFVFSVFVAIIGGFVMNNPFLGILFFILGWIVPKQVVVFIKNQRVNKMEGQIGSFMGMTIKRYENTKDFNQALELTQKEFLGEEPVYSEIRRTVNEIKTGVPVEKALANMANRTGNRFMARFADYYKIAASIGTEEVRNNLLNQAYLQFEEYRKNKSSLKRELSVAVREAYVMVFAVPAFAVFQVFTTKGYVAFMTQTSMGKIGTAVILAVLLGCIWFINKKIGAPLD